MILNSSNSRMFTPVEAMFTVVEAIFAFVDAMFAFVEIMSMFVETMFTPTETLFMPIKRHVYAKKGIFFTPASVEMEKCDVVTCDFVTLRCFHSADDGREG